MPHFLGAFLCILSLFHQQAWVGKKVMPRKEAVIEVAGKEVPPDQFIGLPYRVIEAKGGWLRLAHPEVARVRAKHVLLLDRADAYYAKLLRADPNDAWAYSNRAIMWEEKLEFDKAIDDYSTALRLDPRAEFYYGRGRTWYHLKQYDEAIKDYSEAIQFDNAYSYAHDARGLCRQLQGDFDGAMRDYDEAFRLDPTDATNCYHRGDLYVQTGRIELAIEAFERAIELDKQDPDAYERLARIRSTNPAAEFRDGKKAVELATKACELSEWKNYWSLSTLAAAYAEAGDFDAAQKWEQEAEKFAPDEFKDPTAHKWRMSSYQLKRPLRDSGSSDPGAKREQ